MALLPQDTNLYPTLPFSLSVSFRGSYCPFWEGMGVDAINSLSQCPSDWNSDMYFDIDFTNGGPHAKWWANFDGDCAIYFFGMSIFCLHEE